MISFELGLGRSSDSISLKHVRVVGAMERWSCIALEQNRPNVGGAGAQANSRIFGK